MCSKQEGFTFIEILMTLTIIAVLFVPVMQLFSHSMGAAGDSLDLIVATNLAKSEMERTINLNLTKAQLKALGEQINPPLTDPPMAIDKTLWRVRREVVEGSDPLEVRVHVYREADKEHDVVTLTTLIEDMMWEFVKPVSS